MADEKSVEELQSSSGKKTSHKEQFADVNGRLKSMGDNESSSSRTVSSKKKKKKKAKEKKQCCDHDHHGESEHDAVDACCSGHDHAHEHSGTPSANQIKDLQKFFDAMKMDGKPPKTAEEAKKKKYLFWDTQPVPKLGKSKVFIILEFFLCKISTCYSVLIIIK